MKIEVGKTYIDKRDNKIEIFFYDKEENIFYARFPNDFNFVRTYKENGEPLFSLFDKLIKEHKEPIKKSITGWLNYNDNEAFARYIVDIMTGKDASVYFYRTKEEAQADLNSAYPKTMKFKLDFEQIED